MDTTIKSNNIYQRGAADGLIMGAYLVVQFALEIAGMRSPVCILLSAAMLLGVPVLAFVLLRSGYRMEGHTSQFSAIWMHGITMFICGCLILGLAAYIYFRFINPTFIADMFNEMAALYASMDTQQSAQIAEMMHRMVDKHLLPTPIAFAFAMMWVGSFGGAMLSLIIACILKLITPRSK